MPSTIKSIFKWLLISLVTIFIGSVAALLIFKDRIIQQVLVEVNKSLQVPIEIGEVDIDFFHGFPKTSIAFNDVYLPADAPEPFIEAKKLYAILNPIDIIKGVVNIDRLDVIDAKLNIYVDKNNKLNVDKIFIIPEQGDADSEEESKPASFSLNAVLLKNVKVNYINDYTGSSQSWDVQQIVGSISFEDNIYTTLIDGDLIATKISSRKWISQVERNLIINLQLKYGTDSRNLEIMPSVVRVDGASFELEGVIIFNKIPKIDVTIAAEELSFEFIGSALPEKIRKKLVAYKNSGKINFEASIKGEFRPNSLPGLNSEIRILEADLFDQKNNTSINNLNLTAALSISDIGNLETGKLIINDAKGLLEQSPFTFDIAVSNFLRPKYSANFSGDIATSWLLADTNYPYHESAKGNVAINIKAKEEFGKDNQLIKSDLSGSFELNDISFKWSDTVSIDKINGVVRFSGNDLSLSNISMKWLSSDILINGSIQDIRPTGVSPSGNLLLRSDIKSNYMNVEDIVALIRDNPIKLDTSASDGKKGVDLELVWLINQLKFKKFLGSNISADVSFQDDLLEIKDLLAKGIGGAMKVNGKLKLMKNKGIYVSSNVVTKGVHLDSLFYVFNNFQQEFIIGEELKGQLYADVDASMYFDSTWRFRRPLLTSRAKLRIVEGELNDFEPLMALSPYLDDKDDNLSQLRFSDLVNHVTIKEDTVFIPEMVVRTNVRNIAIGGYHTLSQHINYQLAVPIISERVDKDEAFGAIKKSSKGSPNLLFTIKGTTADYKVNYDLLRATGNVLKLLDITKIFKKKEVEQIDSTFLDDEEFDWEN